jgi:hypothetical protein
MSPRAHARTSTDAMGTLLGARVSVVVRVAARSAAVLRRLDR